MDRSVDTIVGLGNSHVLAGWAMFIQSSALGPFEGGIKNVMSFSSDHLEWKYNEFLQKVWLEIYGNFYEKCNINTLMFY